MCAGKFTTETCRMKKKLDYSIASIYLSTFLGHSVNFTDCTNVYDEKLKYLSKFLQNN